MKSMLKSFIRKTRGENQQHSERGKKFLNSRKKLEKKKKPRYWRCSPDRRSTAATGKGTILWSRKSRRLFALFVHSPLDRFVKDFTSLIYFLLFIRRLLLFFFLWADDFAIVYYYWMYLLLFSSFCLWKPERLLRNYVFFLRLLLILIYIVFLWYFLLCT